MTKAWRWGKKVVEIAQELLEGGLAIISIRQSSCCFNEFMGSSVYDPKTCGKQPACYFPPGPQQGRASLILGVLCMASGLVPVSE